MSCPQAQDHFFENDWCKWGDYVRRNKKAMCRAQWKREFLALWRGNFLPELVDVVDDDRGEVVMNLKVFPFLLEYFG